jgi:hypothetical protein
MDEVFQYIINLIRSNPDILSLLGGIISDPPVDADDDRIYGYPGTTDIVYDSTRQAAIIYKDSLSPMPNKFSYPSQRPDSTIYFQVVGVNKTVVKQVEEELHTLLNLIPPFTTTNWKIGTIMIQGSDDSSDEGTATYPLIIRNVRMRLKEVFKRIP